MKAWWQVVFLMARNKIKSDWEIRIRRGNWAKTSTKLYCHLPVTPRRPPRIAGQKAKYKGWSLVGTKFLHLGVQYQNKLQRSRHPNSTRIPTRLTTQTNVGWPWPWTTPKAFSPFETYPVFARKRSWYEVITITAKPSKPVPHLRQFPNLQTTICSKGSSQSAEPWARVANLLCPTKSYSLRSPGEVCCRWLGPATWKIVRRMQWLDISGYHNLPANLYSTGDKYKSLKHIFKASSTHTIHVRKYMHITNFSRFARLNGC